MINTKFLKYKFPIRFILLYPAALVLFMFSNKAFAERRYFTGTIGKNREIALRYEEFFGAPLRATYFYRDVGIKIELTGAHEKDGTIHLSEFKDRKELKGVLKVSIVSGSFKGFWTNPDETKTLEVDLQERPSMTEAEFDMLRPDIRMSSQKNKDVVEKPEPFEDLFSDFERDRDQIVKIIFSARRVAQKGKACLKYFHPASFHMRNLNWELRSSKLIISTPFPVEASSCKATVQILVRKLAPFLSAHGKLGKYAEKSRPNEVVETKYRREMCLHWGGEGGFDLERSHEIESARIELKCEQLEEDIARLIKKYGKGSREAQKLIEPVEEL